MCWSALHPGPALTPRPVGRIAMLQKFLRAHLVQASRRLLLAHRLVFGRALLEHEQNLGPAAVALDLDRKGPPGARPLHDITDQLAADPATPEFADGGAAI